ncbi:MULTISPECIES: hypothetical protein [unclassified Thioalkalivibrio]|uniref:hypothetical protein n=1 Tax=unclassified Thioalkalivibrio TaxID=2621013 RepID=UPI00036B1E56|nr:MULTISPECIES: hypothetical protein [unclassified Thioalkalivibrio]
MTPGRQELSESEFLARFARGDASFVAAFYGGGDDGSVSDVYAVLGGEAKNRIKLAPEAFNLVTDMADDGVRHILGSGWEDNQGARGEFTFSFLPPSGHEEGDSIGLRAAGYWSENDPDLEIKETQGVQVSFAGAGGSGPLATLKQFVERTLEAGGVWRSGEPYPPFEIVTDDDQWEVSILGRGEEAADFFLVTIPSDPSKNDCDRIIEGAAGCSFGSQYVESLAQRLFPEVDDIGGLLASSEQDVVDQAGKRAARAIALKHPGGAAEMPMTARIEIMESAEPKPRNVNTTISLGAGIDGSPAHKVLQAHILEERIRKNHQAASESVSSALPGPSSSPRPRLRM